VKDSYLKQDNKKTISKKRILSYLGIMLLSILLFSSCAGMQNTLYLLFIDDIDGDTFLQNQHQLRIYLDNIVYSQENISIRTYARTLVAFQFIRTRLLSHSYYVLVFDDGRYHTLSFFGTRFAFRSEGAWVLDGKSDITSYRMLRKGNNRWDVVELFRGEIIDARQTLTNIIHSIDSDITYYFWDNFTSKPNVNNCNTALFKTIVLKR